MIFVWGFQSDAVFECVWYLSVCGIGVRDVVLVNQQCVDESVFTECNACCVCVVLV